MVTCHDVVSEDPPETDSSESSDSDDSDSDTSWRSMSPIPSDEEYSDNSDDDDDGDTSSHETVATADSSSSTSINLLQSSNHASAVIRLILYKLYGDNTDKIVHQRYMRSDIHGTISLHYFHSYAIADRIDFSGLSEETQSLNLDNEALAFMLLPSLEDEEALRKNFKILIARCLYDNVPFFKTTFDGVVNWHIQHCYSDEMSKKSVTVSPFMLPWHVCYVMMVLYAVGSSWYPAKK